MNKIQKVLSTLAVSVSDEVYKTCKNNNTITLGAYSPPDQKNIASINIFNPKTEKFDNTFCTTTPEMANWVRNDLHSKVSYSIKKLSNSRAVFRFVSDMIITYKSAMLLATVAEYPAVFYAVPLLESEKVMDVTGPFSTVTTVYKLYTRQALSKAKKLAADKDEFPEVTSTNITRLLTNLLTFDHAKAIEVISCTNFLKEFCGSLSDQDYPIRQKLAIVYAKLISLYDYDSATVDKMLADCDKFVARFSDVKSFGKILQEAISKFVISLHIPSEIYDEVASVDRRRVNDVLKKMFSVLFTSTRLDIVNMYLSEIQALDKTVGAKIELQIKDFQSKSDHSDLDTATFTNKLSYIVAICM